MTVYNTCTICGEMKPSDMFVKDKRILRGYRNQCKACEVKRVAKSLGQTYYQRGSVNRIHSKNLVAPEFIQRFDFFRRKLNDTASRVIKNGKPGLDHDFMYYWEVLVKQDFKCAISGMDLVFEYNSPWTLSPDCIEPEKGYALDNVQFVTWAANRAKGDLSPENFKLMIDAIYKTQEGDK